MVIKMFKSYKASTGHSLSFIMNEMFKTGLIPGDGMTLLTWWIGPGEVPELAVSNRKPFLYVCCSQNLTSHQSSITLDGCNQTNLGEFSHVWISFQNDRVSVRGGAKPVLPSYIVFESLRHLAKHGSGLNPLLWRNVLKVTWLEHSLK